MPARVAQQAIEALARPALAARLAQQAVEACAAPLPAGRVAQQAIEAASRAASPGRRVMQQAVEVVARQSPARRVAQQAIEALARPAPAARLAQQAVEACAAPVPTARLLQQGIEVAWREPPAPGLFAFRHDWSAPWRETWSWATDVIESRDGDESRIRLRQRPLRTARVNVLGIEAGSVNLDAWLYAHQGRVCWLPLWRAGRWLADAAAVGADRLALIGLDTLFVRALQSTTTAGVGPALLLDADGDAQQIWIAGIDAHAGAVRLREPLVRAVGHDARLAPLVAARLIDSARLVRLAGAVSGLDVSFEIAPPLYVHSYTPAADALFEGLPVLAARNWVGKHAITHAGRVDTLDNGIAAVWSRRRNERPGRLLTWSLLAEGEAAIGGALGLFETLAGRHAECWLEDELVGIDLAAPALAGDQWLTVTRRANPSFLAEGWRALRVCALGQAPLALRMSGIASESDTTARLLLAAPLSAPLPAGARIHGLRRCRLDQDGIEFIWHTSTVLEVAVTFAELPESGKRLRGEPSGW